MPRKFKIAFEVHLDPRDRHQRHGVHRGHRPKAGAGFHVTAGGARDRAPGRGDPRIPADLGSSSPAPCFACSIATTTSKAAQPHEFAVKTMGLDAMAQEGDRSCPASGCAARWLLDIETPETERRHRPPFWITFASTFARGQQVRARIMPNVIPVPNSRDEDHAVARRTSTLRNSSGTMVVATIPLGDMTSAQMRVVGDRRRHGDGTVRVTMEQDPRVPVDQVRGHPSAMRRLSAAGLGQGGHRCGRRELPGRRVVHRLAVTQSRGLIISRGPSAPAPRSVAAAGARIRSAAAQRLRQHHIAPD